MPNTAITVLARVRDAASPLVTEMSSDEIARARTDRNPFGGALGRGFDAVVRRVTGAPHPDAVVAELVVAGAEGDLPARLVAPRVGPRGGPLVVHLHGGGFVVGGPALYDWHNTHLAVALGATVVSVDYRKAPEHPAPAAVEDAVAATRDLLDRAPSEFGTSGSAAVVGDSAGGNLAALVALELRDDPRLRAQWLQYPATDLTRSMPSHDRLVDAPLLSRPSLDAFLHLYLAGGVAADDPAVSPMARTDLAGQCPALVQVALVDPLVDEGVEWGRRLAAAGVEVSTTTWADQPHGFLSLPGLTRQARRALDEGVAFLAEHLRDAPAAPAT